jgi:hypothetical protein
VATDGAFALGRVVPAAKRRIHFNESIEELADAMTRLVCRPRAYRHRC